MLPILAKGLGDGTNGAADEVVVGVLKLGAANGKSTMSAKLPLHLVPMPMMGFGEEYFFRSSWND